MKYSEKIAQAMDIPVGTIADVPRIELWGTGRLTIEGHHGLLRYENECVMVSAKDMIITVTGFDLELEAMSRADLAIKGIILSVGLEKEGQA